ncbi:MAG: B12-binding domain-containing radical SAM protein [bacterium]|nr:B12-binding domain-containing radical SAM protein [bacterium]
MEKYLYTRNKDNNNYNFVMAYPAKKEFGLSSLGYMWLYKIADTTSGINLSDANTDEPIFKTNNVKSVAFSVSFDFDFIGILKILDSNKIPFKRTERSENQPLIFAGGPVITTNPAPYINLLDFMIIGDGENVFEKVLNILVKNLPKTRTLEELSQIDGVFVPDISKKVKKNTANLSEVIYSPILSDESYFKNTFIIEIERGCSNGCAFCTASYLNMPIRYYPYDKIIKAIDFGLKHTNKIALLGAQVTAHPDFEKIITYLKEKINTGNNIEFGISSLRTDSITPTLIKTLVLGGQKTSTIAIESATERLRNVINKNLSQKQIFDAVTICRENGLKGLKIYSMIGIPTETDKDIEAFIELAKELKKSNKGFEISFSFSTFVPKPKTPFQWCKREDTKSLEKKQKYLEKEFAKIGIETKFSSPKWDYWQTILSNGNEKLSDFMIEVYKLGGRNSAYKSALKTCHINTEAILNKTSPIMPWDIVECSPKTETLENTYKKLIQLS